MKITDEMVKIHRLAEQRVEAEGGSINAAMRAGLEAVAPLIAAQERAGIVVTLTALAEQHEANGDVFENEFAAGIREAIEKIERAPSGVPTGGTPNA